VTGKIGDEPHMDDQAEQFDDRYMELLEAARDHWWVRGMQEIGATLIGPVDRPIDVLDAGCGTGALLPWAASLTAPSLPVAIDVSPAAVERCRTAGLPAEFEVASVTDLPYDDGRFDLVLSSDVLQHLTIDQASSAASETARVLRPGGRLLIRTNSAQGRRGVAERDDWRMYTPASLRSVLEGAGLEVDRLSSVNMIQGAWASIPRRAIRQAHDHETLVDEHRAQHGLGIPEPVGERRNRIFLSLLRWEARYLRKPGRSLPFGHSLYAVARRP
jgi:SAM-dependent methyltransferase